MEESKTETVAVDSISELQSLTMSFLKQMEELVGNGLIMCPKLESIHADGTTMDYSNVVVGCVLLISRWMTVSLR